MTLQQKIQNEPYFKAQNCTDINDVEYAIAECKKLLAEYGSKSSLCSILSRLTNKKQKLEAKASASNMHPIFQQALAPFGIR
jgi:hypothetical protein